MNPIRRFSMYAFALAASIALAACSQLEPAKQALASAEAAVNTAAPEAGKYVPDQLAAVQSKLQTLKTSFDNKDYKAVIAGAPAVVSEAQGLVAAAAAKKDEVMKALNGEWTDLAAKAPQLLAAVQSKVDALSKTKKLPKDVDLNTAKSSLASANDMWSKAQAAFSAGNLEEAVTSAKDAAAKGQSAAAAIKLNVDAPAAAAAK
jgi:hypothetical protein